MPCAFHFKFRLIGFLCCCLLLSPFNFLSPSLFRSQQLQHLWIYIESHKKFCFPLSPLTLLHQQQPKSNSQLNTKHEGITIIIQQTINRKKKNKITKTQRERKVIWNEKFLVKFPIRVAQLNTEKQQKATLH